MPMDYDMATAELYRSPLADFVATRRRLAVELKTTDKAQAKRFEKLARPSISAWAVNQLWWRARPSFDALLDSAARLRAGDQSATRAHRDALADLRRRAAAILGEDAHAASEAVLRRVTHTLAALAASGGFDPDAPGTLVQDRDPPGFEAIDPASLAAHATADEMPDREREATAASARAEQERKRIEEQRAQARAQRQRIERELQQAEADAELSARAVDRSRQALADAERELERARALAADLRTRLLSLELP